MATSALGMPPTPQELPFAPPSSKQGLNKVATVLGDDGLKLLLAQDLVNQVSGTSQTSSVPLASSTGLGVGNTGSAYGAKVPLPAASMSSNWKVVDTGSDAPPSMT